MQVIALGVWGMGNEEYLWSTWLEISARSKGWHHKQKQEVDIYKAGQRESWERAIMLFNIQATPESRTTYDKLFPTKQQRVKTVDDIALERAQKQASAKLRLQQTFGDRF